MRLAHVAAATLTATVLTFGTAGVALADTVTPATSSVITQAEPGVLTLSNTSVEPGQTITFSGTFAEPAASTATGAITVTSPAFAGPATMDKTNPEAFSGSATIASGAKAGSYTVTASSSAGTVNARLTVAGAGPAPTPAHHGGTTGTGTHHGTGTGSSSGTDSTEIAAFSPAAGSDALPWVLGGAGVIVLIGGGAYAMGRGRKADRTVEQDRTEVMTRR